MECSEYLIHSARLGDLEAINECLTDGETPVGSIDADGNIALHMASANGLAEVCARAIIVNCPSPAFDSLSDKICSQNRCLEVEMDNLTRH